MLALVDALNIIDAQDQEGRPIPFSLRYCKVTTGEIVDFGKVVKSDITKHKTQSPTGRVVTKLKRKPNHSFNRTRNIRVCGTDQVRCIGIFRILEVNNEKVFI